MKKFRHGKIGRSYSRTMLDLWILIILRKPKPSAQASHQPRPPHQLPQEEVHDPSAQALSEGCASGWLDGCSAWAEAEVEVVGSAAGGASEACSIVEAKGSEPKPVAAPAEGEERRLRWQLRRKCSVCHEEERYAVRLTTVTTVATRDSPGPKLNELKRANQRQRLTREGPPVLRPVRQGHTQKRAWARV